MIRERRSLSWFCRWRRKREREREREKSEM